MVEMDWEPIVDSMIIDTATTATIAMGNFVLEVNVDGECKVCLSKGISSPAIPTIKAASQHITFYH
ncbi:hypothetical protein FRX31_011661 [Thalictrum thalictroides]|uniref:Uncharacterized protein n=1 Tax=Thalictrum thalictroides TaxID=46969 RepID=A0A7J6WRK6_THATH|nr:hypothetical protein FRX31_011661 [Thalictrum thalictroides]